MRCDLRRAAIMLLTLLATLGALARGDEAVAQEVWTAGDTQMRLNVNEAKFLRLEEAATAVFLSNPNVADVDLQSARYLYVVGRSIGETTLFVLGADDEPMVRATIDVGVDTDRLTAAAQRSVSAGAVSVSTVDGALFLHGTVRSAEDAMTAEDVVAGLVGEGAVIVNRLDLETPSQVNLQVTIAEVSRTIQEDLGIALTATSSGGDNAFTPGGTGIDGFQVAINRNGGNLNLVLDALAETGLATILSEPNLTARSGETATFLAGGRIPYRTGATEDDTRVEFQPIGVELEFTPTVYDQSQIQVQLTTRVRDIDSSRSTSEGTPALSERSAATTIEVGSGQSFAIAGMFRADSRQGFSGMPGLSRVPVLGALFRSSRYSRGETELVIIVTPYVVKPTDRRQLTTPVDGLMPARSGLEQAATGNFLRPGAAGQSRVRGQGGFLLNR